MKVCCTDLMEFLLEGVFIVKRDKTPCFRDIQLSKETVFFISDGGHHGYVPLQYCCFCGTKLEIAPEFLEDRKNEPN